MKPKQHVIPDYQGGWSVIRSGAARATKHFDSKTTAIEFARKICEKQASELVVHSTTGAVKTRTPHN